MFFPYTSTSGAVGAPTARMVTTSAPPFSAVRSLCRALVPLSPFKSSSRLFSRRLCHVAVSAKVKSSDPSLKNILDLIKEASSQREIVHTGFLTPNLTKELLSAVEKLSNVKAIAQGGYPQAERCRVSIGHEASMKTNPDVIAAISISGNFKFEQCSHGDFLGAILGTGIKRDNVGDILMQGEKGAQVLVVPEMADYISNMLDKVKTVEVSCTQIPLLALEYEPPRTKLFKTVEASLRVDAVASAGFKLSRSKLVDLISTGDVKVNWTPVMKNGFAIKTGDIVSVSAQGRLKIGEIKPTRKGKYVIELIRYF